MEISQRRAFDSAASAITGLSGGSPIVASTSAVSLRFGRFGLKRGEILHHPLRARPVKKSCTCLSGHAPKELVAFVTPSIGYCSRPASEEGSEWWTLWIRHEKR